LLEIDRVATLARKSSKNKENELAEVQRTIQRPVGTHGVGLFTGAKVCLRLIPAEIDQGILFRRTDLSGQPVVPAHLSFVRDSIRCTKIATEQASVLMVEHLLSALSALKVDNLIVEMEGPELPAGDGSARIFIELLEQAGIQNLEAPRKVFELHKPLYYSHKEAHLFAVPSEEFRISYTLHYPKCAILGSQYFSIAVKEEVYKNEIALSRTFSLYEEISPLIEQGALKGGGLENAIVIKDERVLNPEGVRFPNEMVRHKILDLIGDLFLLGGHLKAHVFAIRSGHATNIAFANLLLKELG
jgi:UDP-3-O-[3-hydroxymyristoyl] N-acetylglucosamine deacetylase